MGSPDRQPATPEKVIEMASNVRLRLDEARAQALCPWVDMVFSLLDGLDAVELGELPPSFAFKCRWTDAGS